eukprot:g25547.t1
MQRMDPGWGWGRGRTIQNALNEYKEQIHHQPHPGEDAAHPRNQGLLAHTLCEFWKHFQGFILGENMHSVVNTIVKPLTDARRSSFVCLWGGRKVDYFVSHSWGTSFRHFVQSIQSHALSKEGEDWKFASYWICSFANNQWNIEAELGASIMESNVVNLHPWLYYLHALYCAYVCYTVKTLVYDAQDSAHPHVRQVLKWCNSPACIPEEFVSEDKVREFFGLALGNDVLQEVHLLKKTKKLQQLVAYRDHSIDCKKQAEFQFEKDRRADRSRGWERWEGPIAVNVGQVPEKVDSIEFYTDEVKKTEEAIADEYHRIQEESKKVGGVNCRNGFVTFKDRKSVELAKDRAGMAVPGRTRGRDRRTAERVGTR